MRKIVTLAAGLAAAALIAAPAVAGTTSSTATFRGGSGNYLTTSGTDNLSQVSGTIAFTNNGDGNLTATGSVTGLPAGQAVVPVAYKDSACIPSPGITAFPGGIFVTDANGNATFRVTVNPKSLNPTATLQPSDVHSVSIRDVVTAGQNLPVGSTPTVPQIGAVRTCDRNPA